MEGFSDLEVIPTFVLIRMTNDELVVYVGASAPTLTFEQKKEGAHASLN